MKKQIIILTSLLSWGSFPLLAQQKAPYDPKTDWAYLNRYAEANKAIKAPAANEKRVVFLGNSITEMWVNADTTFWKGKPYIGRGIGGQTTPQVLLRFRQDVIALQPTVVVINIGINDIAENTGPYSLSYTTGNIQTMLELAKAHHIKVVLASVLPAAEFPWRTEIKDAAQKVLVLNEKLIELAVQYNCVYLDYHTAMKDERNGLPKKYAFDEVHPTLEGYKVMAVLAEKAITEAYK
jgi:lysophospholipase L1-like esterase